MYIIKIKAASFQLAAFFMQVCSRSQNKDRHCESQDPEKGPQSDMTTMNVFARALPVAISHCYESG